MTKFKFEDRINMLLGYKKERTSQSEYVKEIGVTKAQFQYWLRLYELHGEEGLKTSTYTNYTAEFKLDVLNFMAQSGTSLMDTAATFKIPTFTMVYEWKKKFELGGLDALEPKKKGRPSVAKDNEVKSKKQVPFEGSEEALQAEINRLRMENAYLKKLNALVQNKEKSPNKTKHK
jgi:transposase